MQCLCTMSLQGHSAWAGCSELPSGQRKEDHSLMDVGTGKSNSQGRSTACPGAQPWEICLLWDLKEGTE